ncbi:protocadherin gamma-C3-like isoform X5 [Ambystoma mexicanum]|uniref:protocadherin gamma-C3-like isoform X5 n=1 Tax=Ambystoma mexicanum TaxID=8296 RepID=UPI0037E897A4
MKPSARRAARRRARQVLSFCLLLGYFGGGSAVLRYTVPEEAQRGHRVGNVVADLGLDVKRLSERRLRVVCGSEGRSYFEADLESGALLVNERIDREELCGAAAPCLLTLEVVVELPLELYSAVVEVQDINDNDPAFLAGDVRLDISESLAPGARFPLESAQDPDVGMNSLQTYRLSTNEHFSLSVQTGGDGTKYAELVLEKGLDREEQEELHLTLTGVDGGSPARSASVQILVHVQDANDNAPVFNQSLYRASVLEETPPGTLIVRVHAVDLDQGPNGDIVYSFSSHTPAKVRELFSLDSLTGELSVKGPLDYEQRKDYEIYIQAKDKGSNPQLARCKVLVAIIDVNDNAPEITVTSLYSPVPEDALPGTVVALLSVTDLDFGDNGLVNCFIPSNIPFSLSSSIKNYYTLQTMAGLDRELVSEYNITITATDSGTPSLKTEKKIQVQLSDVNDNAPISQQLSYDVYVTENNSPGVPIFNISASDPDANQNGRLSYSILENGNPGDVALRYFSINSDNGTIYVLAPLDHEGTREYKMIVRVVDGGSPARATDIPIHVFVIDTNDNAPSVLYPPPNLNSAQVDSIPRSLSEGSLVTKVVAWDADAGHNAWISYSLAQATESTLFKIGLHSGEIRTAREVLESDPMRQTLIISIADNGQPSLSSTVTLTILMTDTASEVLAHDGNLAAKKSQRNNLTFYLILAVVLVSVFFFITLLTVGVVKLYKWKKTRDLYNNSRSTLYRASETLNYVDAVRSGLPPHNLYHQVYLTTDSRKTDTIYKMRCSPSPLGSQQNTLKLGDPNIYNQLLKDNSRLQSALEQAQPFQQSQPFQQAPPNTDWRFSQAQRPGTSGSQNSEEAGGWPNNQFETERLQAMILASANEGADGSSTLGGGAGTMGLSTRYGPQFTLQHVPDYRQNVYIPGSTATLTNAAGKRDGKSAAASGGNKKKSGKKEKK